MLKSFLFKVFIAVFLLAGVAGIGWILYNNAKHLAQSNTNISLPQPKSANQPLSNQLVEYPKYNGRPADEFRPSQKITRLFTEDILSARKNRLQELAKELREDQYDPVVWKEIGVVKNNIEDYIGARDAFEYWHALSPGNSLALYNLATLYAYHLDDKVKAESYLKEALSFDLDPMYYMQLADMYRYFFNDNARTEKIALEGIAKNPSDVNLLLYLAAFYRENGNVVKAIEYFEKAYAVDPRPDMLTEINELRKKL